MNKLFSDCMLHVRSEKGPWYGFIKFILESELLLYLGGPVGLETARVLIHLLHVMSFCLDIILLR